MNLPKFALENKTITLTTMFLALVWGIWAFFTVPRNEDPSYSMRTCAVGVTWPAANAKKVEQLITIPLEKAFSTLVEVRRLRSESRVGLSIIFIDLEQRRIKNLEDVWNKIRAKAAQVAPTLPQGASAPFVDTEFGEVESMMLALYSHSQKYTNRDLRKFGKTIQSHLTPLPMMGRVAIMGVQDEVINLEVPSGVWSKLQLSTEQLAYALQERNVIEPGGSIDTKLAQFIVRLTGEFTTTQQIETVPVGSLDQQSPTYLRDMGINVVRTYPDPPSLFCRYSDKDFGKGSYPCIIVTFNMKRGGNLVTLGETIRKKVQELNEKVLPHDVTLSIIADQPKQVEHSMGSLFSNLWQGMAIVIGVGFLLTTVRLALIMATAIPLVLVPTIGIMTMFGIEIEQVSISALIVALGMVVDNAIETSENIQRLLLEGKSRFEAVWQGSQQVAVSMLTATATTLAAFLPMLIIPGELGQYIYSLPVVVSLTLIVSWFYALTVNTIFAYWFVQPTVVQGGILAMIVRLWIAILAVISRIRHGQGEVLSFTRKLWAWVMGKKLITEGEEEGAIRLRYGNILPACLRHRYISLGICILIMLGCFWLGAFVPDQFFPLAHRDQFLIDIWLPASTPIHRTEEVCWQVEQIIRDTSQVTIESKLVERFRNMTSFIGGSVPRFYITVDPQPDQPNFAQILVNTTNADYTDQYMLDIRNKINQKIVGGRIIVKKLNLGTLTGAPIALRITGPDPDKLRPIATDLKSFLCKNGAVLDVYDDWGDPTLQLDIDVNHNLANLAGVTNRDVMKTMNTFLAGQYLTSFQEDDIQIPVYLRLPKTERNAIVPLQHFYVEGRMGRIPIDGIAQHNIVYAESNICRRQQQRAMTVYAFVRDNAFPNDVIKAIMPQIEKKQKEIQDRMPGYSLQIGGEWEETRASDVDVFRAFYIGLILNFLILIIQYNGVLRPVIIYISIIMGIAGGIFGLWISGWPLNFMATLGLVAISGVVVNHSIILIDFIDNFRKTPDMKLFDAVVKACKFRIIPIFLTSFTTIGGLMTLSGPLWAPMRATMAWGLLFETVLTLFVVPCVYYILAHDLKILKER